MLVGTLLAGAGSRMPIGPTVVRFSHGIFDDIPLYLPHGPAQNVVLLLSDRGERDRDAEALALPLVAAGALVAVIDTDDLYEARKDEDCFSVEGDLDNFARNVQGFLRLPSPHTPIVAGEGEGASLAYAMSAEAPEGAFLGTLTLDFCPSLRPPVPLCESKYAREGKRGEPIALMPPPGLPGPWQAVQTPQACAGVDPAGFVRAVPQATLHEAVAAPPSSGRGPDVTQTWRAGYAALAALAPPVVAPPAAVADLPLIEVPLPPGAPAAHTLALLVSGDGGWADIDRELAARLSRQGMRVLGMDALRYFWGARTPDGLAADVDRALTFYLERWKLDDVVLIGFSQGADVLPFAVNRLSEATRERVRRTVLLSPGQLAAFEFRVSNWLSASDDGLPVPAEIERMPAGMAWCVYGVEDEGSACPTLPKGNPPRTQLPGGHHFDEAYDAVADVILKAVRAQP